jgi:hypothetical protein
MEVNGCPISSVCRNSDEQKGQSDVVAAPDWHVPIALMEYEPLTVQGFVLHRTLAPAVPASQSSFGGVFIGEVAGKPRRS